MRGTGKLFSSKMEKRGGEVKGMREDGSNGEDVKEQEVGGGRG